MGELSDVKVRKLKKPGRYTDGDTLYLKVSPSGSKSWIQRLIIKGRRRDLGLGAYPLVSLAEARGRALDNRALARSGGDPMAVKREERLLEALPTFEELAREHIAETLHSWKNAAHGAQWLSTLETYAFPTLGSLKVKEITRIHVKKYSTPSGPPNRRRHGVSDSASAPSWTGPLLWSTSTTIPQGTPSTAPLPSSVVSGTTIAPYPTVICHQLCKPFVSPPPQVRRRDKAPGH